MKKSALFLGLLALTLTACGNQGGGNPPDGDPEDDGYSVVLKDCASKLLQIANTPVSPLKRGFEPYVGAPAQAIAMPAVYLYWSGLLNDIEGVNIVDHAIKFAGRYKFNGMGGNIQDIVFDLSVHFDKENNKFTFLGKQSVPADYQYSYLILTFEYNFTTKVAGDFSTLMQPNGFGSGNYIRYTNNTLESYSYGGTSDGHMLDPDYITYSAIAQSGIDTLEALIANEEVLDGSKLNSAKQALVSASDYCDEVCDGINFDAEVVE